MWGLYKRHSGLVLGFHGCDKTVGERVLNGKERHLLPSDNEYDWLGHGIYFWEGNPARAMQFAEEGMTKPVTKGKIKTPFVVGAVIDLGHCCNLLDSSALEELAAAHETLKTFHEAAGT